MQVRRRGRAGDVAGDRAVAAEIDVLKKSVTAAAFASRGYSVDQPLAIAPRDLANTYTLMPGSELPWLLERHGFKFRIDLDEARRMLD